MELWTYLAILWRRKWVIAVTTFVTLAVVATGTLAVTPTYEATVTLRVLTAAGGAPDWPTYNIGYADRLMNTYSELVTSGPVLGELERRLGLDEAPQIDVEVVPNSELMKVTVEDADPALASDAANALADILMSQNQELYTSGAKTAQEILNEQVLQVESELVQARQAYETLIAQSPEESERIAAAERTVELKEEVYATLLQQYEQARVGEAVRANALSVVEPAAVPEEPASPRWAMNLALGLLLGLAGGVGLAFLLENLDTRLHTTKQIEEVTGLPVVGRVPLNKKPAQAGRFSGNSPQGEALRHIRTNILALHGQALPKTILVTSAERGEGKSSLVTGLAYAMAQAGRHVVVVDADIRKPSLHTIFEVSNRVGLSSILLLEPSGGDGASASFEWERLPGNDPRLEAALETTVRMTKLPGLEVLPSGRLLRDPADSFGSAQMGALLRKLAQHFDTVLIDTPCLAAVPDAAVLAPLVDAVLLVVGRGMVREEAVRSACRRLADTHPKSLSVVVNRSEQDASRSYYQRELARHS